jgi:hypothetical protein
MGNRMYIKVDQNGQMYYVDENGVTVMIPFGGKIKKEGWMKLKAAALIKYDPNIKKYDYIYKVFQSDDKDLQEKISYLD